MHMQSAGEAKGGVWSGVPPQSPINFGLGTSSSPWDKSSGGPFLLVAAAHTHTHTHINKLHPADLPQLERWDACAVYHPPLARDGRRFLGGLRFLAIFFLVVFFFLMAFFSGFVLGAARVVFFFFNASRAPPSFIILPRCLDVAMCLMRIEFLLAFFTL